MQEKTQGLELEAEKQQLLREREQLHHQLENAREKMHSLQASLNLVGGNTTPVQVTYLAIHQECDVILLLYCHNSMFSLSMPVE